jgi:creatinine amidohydrolase/Fe(II)-dependent formamide hydrolase-like protein
MLLSYRELKDALERGPSLAVLPVGCYEQHGPVLPLDTDNLIASECARRLSLELTELHVHVLPLVAYSTTEPNVDYCGTVNVPAAPFRLHLDQVCRSVLASPFDALLILNSHGSITSTLREICFALVNEQFRGAARPVRPVVTANVFDFDHVISAELQQAPGRHADWKEFLLLWSVLGRGYFTEERLERLRAFAGAHDFSHRLPGVLGIPAQLRTADGVQGQPLPKAADYDHQSELIWRITIEHLAADLRRNLDQFRQHYAHRMLSPP